jgi:hypothetical protein
VIARLLIEKGAEVSTRDGMLETSTVAEIPSSRGHVIWITAISIIVCLGLIALTFC